MKKIIVFIFTIMFLYSAPATKEDIKELKSDIKLILKKVNEIDKRVYANSIKIDMLEKNMNKRFELIDKRFEDMNKRFEDMNRRFDFISNIITALVAGIFGLIGFMMWDRRTVVSKAKDECIKEVDIKKADKDYVEKLVKAMNELLIKNDDIAKEVFKKYGLL